MSTTKKFFTSCIAGIAVFASIIATDSQVPAQQNQQNLVKVGADTKYTVAQVERDYHPYPNHYPYPYRRRLAQRWERMRWERYDRCIRQTRQQWRCRYILQERNPYM